MIDYTNTFTDSEDKEKGRLSLFIGSKEQYVMVYILITRTSLQIQRRKAGSGWILS